MKTIFVKQKDIDRKWYIVNAEGKNLGRLAVRVATILRGKHKAIFAPHMDTGDFVVIINAEKVNITGKKSRDKVYYHHTGYPGGLRIEPFYKKIARKPTFPIEHAIRGMLPKGPMGRELFKHVKVYAGDKNPHESQKPEELKI